MPVGSLSPVVCLCQLPCVSPTAHFSMCLGRLNCESEACRVFFKQDSVLHPNLGPACH